jgi:hypothetical protein
MVFAKVGSVLYVVWGSLHIVAAYDEFQLGASLDPGLVQGKINQGAWDLLFFALVSILIAIIYNWKNNRLGYWLNLILVSAADIGFIIFVLLPGRVAIFPGISAAIFSTIGIRAKKNK